MSEVPQVFILSGVTAAGKTTLARMLLEKGAGSTRFERVVTATDRAARPNEQDGVDYHFMSTEEFVRLREDGGFYEWAEVYGQLKGVPRFALDEIRERGNFPLMILDLQGIHNWKQIMGKDAVFSAFVVPDDLEVLRPRLLERDPSIPADELDRRIDKAQIEIRDAYNSSNVDAFIINYQENIWDAYRELTDAFRDRLNRNIFPVDPPLRQAI